MNRIAILTCQKSAEKCCGTDCLKHLSERERSFAPYKGQHVRLAGFTTCSGCDADHRTDPGFGSKIEHLLKAGVSEVHIAACVTSEKKVCPQRENIVRMLEESGLRVCRIDGKG